MNIAFFDFDGTITDRDSFLLFLRQCVRFPKLIVGTARLVPVLLGYKLGVVPNHVAKEKVIAYFFTGKTKEYFSKQGNIFSDQVIPQIARPSALAQIKWHQARGDKVVIVSASIADWLKPWCARMHIDLLATELCYREELFTGTFATKNCYGDEKVSRVLEYLKLHPAKKTYGYGDSKGDDALLKFVDEGYYRIF